MGKINSICVYCGSQPGSDPAFMKAARTLGTQIANANIKLIYGGGTYGLMGEVADGVLDAGGEVTGIIPKFLIGREGRNEDLDKLTEVIITENMHERKQTMFERADAFVTLPGGVGTLEEIVEIMTWAQLGRHKKPIVFANVNDFWNTMFAQLEVMKKAGFLHSMENLKPIIIGDVSKIVETLLAD
ncbi:MAG: TIGR00730 family Rossman fold protein [Rhizobiales bacterium]|nr:TIGR00730 family Rossman fold protein [Hyphomicrobiales bacterium]